MQHHLNLKLDEVHRGGGWITLERVLRCTEGQKRNTRVKLFLVSGNIRSHNKCSRAEKDVPFEFIFFMEAAK